MGLLKSLIEEDVIPFPLQARERGRTRQHSGGNPKRRRGCMNEVSSFHGLSSSELAFDALSDDIPGAGERDLGGIWRESRLSRQRV
jgi:hypothetical protein